MKAHSLWVVPVNAYTLNHATYIGVPTDPEPPTVCTHREGIPTKVRPQKTTPEVVRCPTLDRWGRETSVVFYAQRVALGRDAGTVTWRGPDRATRSEARRDAFGGR